MPKKCDQLEVIEEEMPTVYYLTDIRHPAGLPFGVAEVFWRCTVPSGKKLVVKKVGVVNFNSANKLTDKALIDGGSIWHEYTGAINEINLEFPENTFVTFHAYNTASSGTSHFGVWFMFDFIPV